MKNMYTILDGINSPADLKSLSIEELNTLSAELRDLMIGTVSRNGGHLASSLGAVELAVALHRVFDSPRDKIIWDVGHQCYPHKILTGRRDAFHTLRLHNGISGFPDPFESPHDAFSAGHAGNSISAALGMALARDLSGETYHVAAVIGDGSLGSGLALEAVNHAGHMGKRMTVVLNDNGMSISKSVGSLCRLLDRVRKGRAFTAINEQCAKRMPGFSLDNLVWGLGGRIKNRLNRLMTFNLVWERLGFSYYGPVDGHDIRELIVALERARAHRSRPVILHVITRKGKGYGPAELDAVRFHGVSPKKKSPAPSYNKVFSRSIVRMMRDNHKIVAITAAMLDGTGLDEAARQFPDRVIDVGICEQHAVTLAAALSARGYIPVVAIYSTFLQRSYDQIVNDVCLQRLPVVFAVDRAGIVGDDGKTHQGAFDVSYMRSVPHMVVAAPKDENELQHMLYTAINAGVPMSIRYPRGSGHGVSIDPDFKELPIGKGEILRQGGDVALIAFGSTAHHALAAAGELASTGIDCAVVNARFAKPLDGELIAGVARKTGRIVTIEDNTACGGFGSAVAELAARMNLYPLKIECIGLPDRFIEHGPQDYLRSMCDLDAAGIIRRIRQSFPELILNVYNRKLENIG
jgi:1-deoxy-D-xylulose-5-phosphate synthase